ncbi:hypothetical protein HMPREF1611_02822 [Escherichia coli 908573]|nr:hypothetical protein HMPREF1611_02822 [Escherichia coli 908573]DAN10531.1 MAG TPA: hypothetical protein [Caudoviricetes sp.]
MSTEGGIPPSVIYHAQGEAGQNSCHGVFRTAHHTVFIPIKNEKTHHCGDITTGRYLFYLLLFGFVRAYVQSVVQSF